jgi:adenylosuccinate lyase
LIDRYSLPEMAALFSDTERLRRWLEIELLAVEAWAELGVVPDTEAKAARERAPRADEVLLERVQARERVTDHDVAAFVDVVQAEIGPPAGTWIHFGLTSSDVVDTALAWTLVDAGALLERSATRLVGVLKRRAQELADVAMAGRTHGMHAEPTTLGAKMALWCLQCDRDRERLRRARSAMAVGKLSGAVGTYSNVDPAVERYVCEHLGLEPVPASQVLSRDRHAEYLWALASVGATVELIATEVRHLQRTEVAEAAEPFRSGQKGSSAMPHKRNPVVAERLCGLARLLRANLLAGLEDVALWHERDISHSSVERVILPDSSLLGYYVLEKAAWLIEGLEVRPDRMRANLDQSGGAVFSQSVLLALVASGLERDRAYRIVQQASKEAASSGRHLRSVLAEVPEVAALGARLDDAFDLGRVLLGARRAVDALEVVEA